MAAVHFPIMEIERRNCKEADGRLGTTSGKRNQMWMGKNGEGEGGLRGFDDLKESRYQMNRRNLALAKIGFK